MRSHFLLIFTFTILSFSSYSQVPEWDWARQAISHSFGGWHNGITTTVDPSGNVYALGMTGADTLIFDSDTIFASGTASRIFIAKYDAAGNYIRVRTSAYNQLTYTTGTRIACDNSANIYVAGYFIGDSVQVDNITLYNTGSSSQTEMFIIKYDSTGNVIWGHTIAGIMNDYLVDMEICENADIVITGNFRSYTLDFGTIQLTNPYNQASENAFVARLDSSGTAIWARNAYPSSWPGSVFGMGVAVGESGNTYATGRFTRDSIMFDNITLYNSAPSLFAIFIVKYDSVGNAIWALSAQDSINATRKISVSTDRNGHVYMAGQFTNNFIAFDDDTLFNSGSDNIFIYQFDSQGQALWARKNGMYNVDVLKDMAADTLGNLYVTGSFYDQMVFNNDTINSMNGPQIFAAKYDVNGNVPWYKTTQGFNSADATGIAFNNSGNAFLTGRYDGPFIFGSDTLTGPGYQNYFLARISHFSVSPLTSVICKGDSVTISATGPGTFTWTPSDGLNNTSTSSVIASPDSTITYTVYGTYNGITSLGQSVVTVNPLPPQAIVTVSNDTLDANFWAGIQWFRNDTLIPGATNQIYVVPQPVTYTQCFVARRSNNFGCFSYSDSVCFMSVGINEPDELYLQVFPNPADDILNIRLNSAFPEATLSLFDSKGFLVHSENVHSPETKIQLPASEGIYLLRLQYKDRFVSKRIVKTE